MPSVGGGGGRNVDRLIGVRSACGGTSYPREVPGFFNMGYSPGTWRDNLFIDIQATEVDGMRIDFDRKCHPPIQNPTNLDRRKTSF